MNIKLSDILYDDNNSEVTKIFEEQDKKAKIGDPMEKVSADNIVINNSFITQLQDRFPEIIARIDRDFTKVSRGWSKYYESQKKGKPNRKLFKHLIATSLKPLGVLTKADIKKLMTRSIPLPRVGAMHGNAAQVTAGKSQIEGFLNTDFKIYQDRQIVPVFLENQSGEPLSGANNSKGGFGLLFLIPAVGAAIKKENIALYQDLFLDNPAEFKEGKVNIFTNATKVHVLPITEENVDQLAVAFKSSQALLTFAKKYNTSTSFKSTQLNIESNLIHAKGLGQLLESNGDEEAQEDSFDKTGEDVVPQDGMPPPEQQSVSIDQEVIDDFQEEDEESSEPTGESKASTGSDIDEPKENDTKKEVFKQILQAMDQQSVSNIDKKGKVGELDKVINIKFSQMINANTVQDNNIINEEYKRLNIFKDQEEFVLIKIPANRKTEFDDPSGGDGRDFLKLSDLDFKNIINNIPDDFVKNNIIKVLFPDSEEESKDSEEAEPKDAYPMHSFSTLLSRIPKGSSYSIDDDDKILMVFASPIRLNRTPTPEKDAEKIIDRIRGLTIEIVSDKVVLTKFLANRADDESPRNIDKLDLTLDKYKNLLKLSKPPKYIADGFVRYAEQRLSGDTDEGAEEGEKTKKDQPAPDENTQRKIDFIASNIKNLSNEKLTPDLNRVPGEIAAYTFKEGTDVDSLIGYDKDFLEKIKNPETKQSIKALYEDIASAAIRNSLPNNLKAILSPLNLLGRPVRRFLYPCIPVLAVGDEIKIVLLNLKALLELKASDINEALESKTIGEFNSTELFSNFESLDQNVAELNKELLKITSKEETLVGGEQTKEEEKQKKEEEAAKSQKQKVEEKIKSKIPTSKSDFSDVFNRAIRNNNLEHEKQPRVINQVQLRDLYENRKEFFENNGIKSLDSYDSNKMEKVLSDNNLESFAVSVSSDINFSIVQELQQKAEDALETNSSYLRGMARFIKRILRKKTVPSGLKVEQYRALALLYMLFMQEKQYKLSESFIPSYIHGSLKQLLLSEAAPLVPALQASLSKGLAFNPTFPKLISALDPVTLSAAKGTAVKGTAAAKGAAVKGAAAKGATSFIASSGFWAVAGPALALAALFVDEKMGKAKLDDPKFLNYLRAYIAYPTAIENDMKKFVDSLQLSDEVKREIEEIKKEAEVEGIIQPEAQEVTSSLPSPPKMTIVSRSQLANIEQIEKIMENENARKNIGHSELSDLLLGLHKIKKLIDGFSDTDDLKAIINGMQAQDGMATYNEIKENSLMDSFPLLNAVLKIKDYEQAPTFARAFPNLVLVKCCVEVSKLFMQSKYRKELVQSLDTKFMGQLRDGEMNDMPFGQQFPRINQEFVRLLKLDKRFEHIAELFDFEERNSTKDWSDQIRHAILSLDIDKINEELDTISSLAKDASKDSGLNALTKDLKAFVEEKRKTEKTVKSIKELTESEKSTRRNALKVIINSMVAEKNESLRRNAEKILQNRNNETKAKIDAANRALSDKNDNKLIGGFGVGGLLSVLGGVGTAIACPPLAIPAIIGSVFGIAPAGMAGAWALSSSEEGQTFVPEELQFNEYPESEINKNLDIIEKCITQLVEKALNENKYIYRRGLRFLLENEDTIEIEKSRLDKVNQYKISQRKKELRNADGMLYITSADLEATLLGNAFDLYHKNKKSISRTTYNEFLSDLGGIIKFYHNIDIENASRDKPSHIVLNNMFDSSSINLKEIQRKALGTIKEFCDKRGEEAEPFFNAIKGAFEEGPTLGDLAYQGEGSPSVPYEAYDLMKKQLSGDDLEKLRKSSLKTKPELKSKIEKLRKEIKSDPIHIQLGIKDDEGDIVVDGYCIEYYDKIKNKFLSYMTLRRREDDKKSIPTTKRFDNLSSFVNNDFSNMAIFALPYSDIKDGRVGNTQRQRFEKVLGLDEEITIDNYRESSEDAAEVKAPSYIKSVDSVEDVKAAASTTAPVDDLDVEEAEGTGDVEDTDENDGSHKKAKLDMSLLERGKFKEKIDNLLRDNKGAKNSDKIVVYSKVAVIAFSILKLKGYLTQSKAAQIINSANTLEDIFSSLYNILYDYSSSAFSDVDISDEDIEQFDILYDLVSKVKSNTSSSGLAGKTLFEAFYGFDGNSGQYSFSKSKMVSTIKKITNNFVSMSALPKAYAIIKADVLLKLVNNYYDEEIAETAIRLENQNLLWMISDAEKKISEQADLIEKFKDRIINGAAEGKTFIGIHNEEGTFLYKIYYDLFNKYLKKLQKAQSDVEGSVFIAIAMDLQEGVEANYKKIEDLLFAIAQSLNEPSDSELKAGNEEIKKDAAETKSESDAETDEEVAEEISQGASEQTTQVKAAESLETGETQSSIEMSKALEKVSDGSNKLEILETEVKTTLQKAGPLIDLSREYLLSVEVNQISVTDFIDRWSDLQLQSDESIHEIVKKLNSYVELLPPSSNYFELCSAYAQGISEGIIKRYEEIFDELDKKEQDEERKAESEKAKEELEDVSLTISFEDSAAEVSDKGVEQVNRENKESAEKLAKAAKRFDQRRKDTSKHRKLSRKEKQKKKSRRKTAKASRKRNRQNSGYEPLGSVLSEFNTNLYQQSLSSLLFEDKDYNKQQKVIKQSSLQEEWRRLWDI